LTSGSASSSFNSSSSNVIWMAFMYVFYRH
jgi:hypothetical protein